MAINSIEFQPVGPFELKYDNLPGGKQISKEHAKRFWDEHPELSELRKRQGIYIFGMQITRGKNPAYVGKTKRSFEAECFTDRNLNIYNAEILRYTRNYKPFLFFLLAPRRQGVPNNKVILELEKYIINLAAEKNVELANVRNIDKGLRFSITGLGGGRGKGPPTRAGSFFKEMVDF